LGKILLLIVFVVLTNPISSHALARAAHFIGIPLTKGTVTDQLDAHNKTQEAHATEEVD